MIKKKKNKQKSQITIFFMLLLTMMMMFIVVMMDINKVAINKLIMDITVDNTALSFGSMIASEAKVLSATRLAGGAHRTVMLSDQGVLTMILGIILIVIIIVVFIIVTILTEGVGGAAAVGVGALIGAVTSAMIAMGVWLVGEYSRQQAVIGQWTEAISTFPNKNARYRENLVSMMLPIMAMDREMVRDIHDFSQNSRVSDEVSRFMYLYSHRLNKMIQSDSASQAKLAFNCGQTYEGQASNVPWALLTVTDSLEALAKPEAKKLPSMPFTADTVYDDTNRADNPRLIKGVLDLSVLQDMVAEGVDLHYIQEEKVNVFAQGYKGDILQDYRKDLCGDEDLFGPCEDGFFEKVQAPDTVQYSRNFTNRATAYCLNSPDTNAVKNSAVCELWRKERNEPDADDINNPLDNDHAIWASNLEQLKKEIVSGYLAIKDLVGKKITHDMYKSYLESSNESALSPGDWFYFRGLSSLCEEFYTTVPTMYLNNSSPAGDGFISDMGIAYKLLYYLYDNKKSISTFKSLDKWFAKDLAIMRHGYYQDWYEIDQSQNALWDNWSYKSDTYFPDKGLLTILETELENDSNPTKRHIVSATPYIRIYQGYTGKDFEPPSNSTNDQKFALYWEGMRGEDYTSQTVEDLIGWLKQELKPKPYPSNSYYYSDIYRTYRPEEGPDYIGRNSPPDPYGYCDHETDNCKPDVVKKLFPGATEKQYLGRSSSYYYYSLEDIADNNYQLMPESPENIEKYNNGKLKRLSLWNSAHDNFARPEYEACEATPDSNDCKTLYDEQGSFDDLVGQERYSHKQNRYGKPIVTESDNAPRESSALSNIFLAVQKIRNYVEKVTRKGSPIDAATLEEWETVNLDQEEAKEICNGQSCTDPDDGVLNKYYLMPLTTPRKTMRLMAGKNGMLQNYYEIEGVTVDDKEDGPLLQIPNAYKMESVMNQFHKDYQHFENFVPIQEHIRKPIDPGDPKIRILKSDKAESATDQDYYGNPYEFNFYIPPYPEVSTQEYKPTELRHNPNNLQLVRKLWVLENLLVNVVWTELNVFEQKLLGYNTLLDQIVIDDNNYLNDLKESLRYKKITYPLLCLDEIRKKIVRYCYIPAGENNNPVLNSTNLAQIRAYNSIANVWNVGSFTDGKPIPSLQTIRKDLEAAMDEMTKIRGIEGDFMSDAGEAMYVWRDSAENGGKWHVVYVFSDEDIPYPYVQARQDQKFSSTLGYSWMRPFCNPVFDCVGGGTVKNIDQCSGSGDRIKGIKDGKDKNWHCTSSKSVWVKAARFDEPDRFLGWSMFTSLKEKARWRRLKKDLKMYMQSKADQMFLNEIAPLGPGYFDVAVADPDKPTTKELKLLEKRKKEMHETLATGQILFSNSDANIFVPLRSFLVNNGMWSRSQVTVKPTIIDNVQNEASGMGGDDWVGLFLFGIPPIGTKAEWVEEIVDWSIEITDTGSDCGTDSLDRCSPDETVKPDELLEKFLKIKDILNSNNK